MHRTNTIHAIILKRNSGHIVLTEEKPVSKNCCHSNDPKKFDTKTAILWKKYSGCQYFSFNFAFEQDKKFTYLLIYPTVYFNNT